MKTPFGIALCALVAAACGSDPNAPPCDPERPPVIMAHGFLAAGDTWAPFAQAFAANGDCPHRLFAFDWNPFDRNAALETLEAFVDGVLEVTGAPKAQLIGHSAGGSLAFSFLEAPARAAKIDRYVHIGSAPTPIEGREAGPAGPEGATIPTLNLWSEADTIVAGGDIPGATNARFADLDHYEVATAGAAFAEVYAFLRGEAARTSARGDAPVKERGRRQIAGKALTLGENIPVEGWSVHIFEVQEEDGERTSEAPVASLVVREDGGFGPIAVRAGVHHELHLVGEGEADREVHYYREPFIGDDSLVYLRALPGPGSLVGLLFGGIPFTDASPVLIAFSASRAVIAGRDTLRVAGEELATESFAAPERTAIAWFFFDEDEDGEDGEDGAMIGLFSFFQSFLAAIDRYYPVSDPGPLVLELNGRRLAVPRWAGAADGATVAIFD